MPLKYASLQDIRLRLFNQPFLQFKLLRLERKSSSMVNYIMIWVIDFGGQTAHLITRRLRDLGSPSKLVEPEKVLTLLETEKPQGIIFSGGPASVYEDGAPIIDPKVYLEKIPSLDICYGLQLRSHLLGGEVKPGTKEYGPVILKIVNCKLEIAKDLPKSFVVWMSHGDSVLSMPENFKVIGSSDNVHYAFVADEKKKQYGLQFHPEAEHTEFGNQILKNFIEICGLKVEEQTIDVDALKQEIKKQVGDAYVIGAISGGVDSTVAGILAAEAIGKQFIPVYVENGLMREGTAEFVETIFKKHGIKPIIANVEDEMLALLKGIEDPEQKRKIIGKFYIDVFEREMKRHIKIGLDVKFLLQGTIYSDVIESKGTNHSSKIKSHHNVGGLPENMKLKLLEPVRSFYKDQVRQLGKLLGLPDSFVWRQTFPGPGYSVRIRGEVTKERLMQEKKADKIVLEEIEKAGWMRTIYMSYPIMSGAFSTAVKGDGRFFGEVVALRVIESTDVMTAHWSNLPYDVLQKISSRIVNEVPGISRVVYDITTKPPATMEWE